MNAVSENRADLASGKGHRDENFPVASFLIAPPHRAAVMAFYRFARAADDVADHAHASADEKLARLHAMRATILGTSDAEPDARGLRETMAARRLDPVHALDLLAAFIQDVTQRRYASWDALIGYCRLSAMPVGRYVLDVHGEDRATWPFSDALCAALQVINHLQDCAKDYAALDRVYLPLDLMAAKGARVEDLGAPAASPALARVIGALAERTEALLAEAAPFAQMIVDRRLALEVAIIHRLAASLASRLRTCDPLRARVHHTKLEAAGIALRAAAGRLFAR